jgi:hypothetical protein
MAQRMTGQRTIMNAVRQHGQPNNQPTIRSLPTSQDLVSNDDKRIGMAAMMRYVIHAFARTSAHSIGTVICLVPLAIGSTRLQDAAVPPVTVEAMTAAIGSVVDARAVIGAAFAQEFGSSRQPAREFFLSSQVPKDWLPRIQGIEFVGLSDREAAALLSKCLTYWVIRSVERSADVVSLVLERKCSGGSHHYQISFDAGMWRADLRGLGSGFVGRPTDCPCL